MTQTKIVYEPSLAIGETIAGRYIVQRFLASGGTAEVYAARHSFTHREVVVKLPAHGSGNAHIRERFEREALALSRARHPGVTELLDAGEHAGSLYLVLEKMEGRTLGGLLAARGKLVPEDAVTIGIRLAEILEHCHRAGIIHRDVKPDNVFMEIGPTGGLKLFDFGIARLEFDPSKHMGRNTQESIVLGTPEYMAPEALQMLEGVDHRVDIFAFGVSLFELLCGTVPIEGTFADLLVTYATREPPTLRSKVPDLPESVYAAVDGCLARDPAQRFRSMTEPHGLLVAAARELERESRLPSPELASLAQASRLQKLTVAQTPASLRSAGDKSQGRPAGAEARRHPRAPYTTPANVRAGGSSLSGRVEEISVGGLQLITEQEITVGETVELRFALPMSGKIHQVTAVARWTRAGRAKRHATGFEFKDLPAETQQIIGEYVTLMGGA